MVISVLGNVAIVGKGIHTKFARVHAVVFLFACTVAEQHAASLALRVPVHAAEGAPMIGVRSTAQSHADHVNSLVRGVALITSATIFVAKNAIALDVTLPVPKSFLAATNVLVCVEKPVPHCALFATLRSCLLC